MGSGHIQILPGLFNSKYSEVKITRLSNKAGYDSALCSMDIVWQD
jgi:hypothetical protein